MLVSYTPLSFAYIMGKLWHIGIDGQPDFPMPNPLAEMRAKLAFDFIAPAKAPAQWGGESHYQYSYSLVESNFWQDGEFAGGNTHSLSIFVDQWKSWSPKGESMSYTYEFSETWSGWNSGPGYEISYTHSEFARTHESYSLSKERGSTFISEFFSQENVHFESIQSLLDGVLREEQHYDREAVTVSHNETAGRVGESSLDVLQIERDSSDFSRLIDGDLALLDQRSESYDFTRIESASKAGTILSIMEQHAVHEYHELSGPDFMSVHSSAVQESVLSHQSDYLLV